MNDQTHQPEGFPKKYDPQSFEKDTYAMWEESGCFSAETEDTGKPTFYTPFPPPNATGILHAGHSLGVSIQDIMSRFQRMSGKETLFSPGIDHAAISTQRVVEKELEAEGTSREALGREAFLERTKAFVAEKRSTIETQVRYMGASMDWDRMRYTFDNQNSDLVNKAFVKMYNEGIIYRGEYMVNYCPKQQTVISDSEVEHREEQGKMYDIAYFVNGTDKELIVSTTRPETLLADQAVAVHPKDKRYKKLIGREVILPIVNRTIPIIADEMVDPDFGSGAVKITPAHDRNDFECAKRNGLVINYRVIDENGIMMDHTGPFAGMGALEARKKIVQMLTERGNLMKEEPHVHQVGYSERGGVRVETIVSTQWFIDNSKLSPVVMEGYEKGDFEFIPDRFGKSFEDWMDKLHEWCISRQLWWGHQIPAYYDKQTDKLVAVSADEEAVYKEFGKDNVYRDADCLDTWFSSALWPFAILDWDFENPAPMFDKYYPAQILETGYDIILFWVIRMLLFGYYFTGKAPFEKIYMHGLVCDKDGKKFSKSLGNGINPLELIDEYSADALRLSLIIGNTPGNNLAFNTETTKNNQLFLNKLWNVARFVMMNTGEFTESYDDLHTLLKKEQSNLLDYEKWILSRLKNTVDEVTQGMKEYNFSQLGERLYTFTRDEFADYAIESYKLSKEESIHGDAVMKYCLLTILKLWHPYIPFITEKIHQSLIGDKAGKKEHMLMLSDWPVCKLETSEELEHVMKNLFEVIYAIRRVRGEKRMNPGDLVDIILYATPVHRENIEKNLAIITGLAKVGKCEFIMMKNEAPEGNSHAYTQAGDVDIYMDISGISHDEEIARIKKLIKEKEDYLRSLQLKLADPVFLGKAPKNVIALNQEKKVVTENQLEKARAELAKYE